MGACLGDLPRFGALDDHTLHPSPSDFNLRGAENGRETDVLGQKKNPFAPCWSTARLFLITSGSTYFSSPPTLSFWWVELGPQVRPFFLLLDRSSFLHTALRPHVLLPSVGVTGVAGQTPHVSRTPPQVSFCFCETLALTSDGSQSGNDPRTGRGGGALAALRLPLVHLGRCLDGDLVLEP